MGSAKVMNICKSSNKEAGGALYFEKQDLMKTLKTGYRGVPVALIVSLFQVVAFQSCIEDDFSSSPSDQPEFSVDTLKLGDVFTLDGTPTKSFKVYNRHSKMMNISSIALRDDDGGLFRLNVDGVSGRTFSNVEIRPKDSIFVFVEATLPENGQDSPVKVERHLDFITNSVSSTVVLRADGQDVTRCKGMTIGEDTRWTANRPYVIFDTLRVPEGVTLTLEPGATIHFHDKAAMKIDGTLISEGTAVSPVSMTGDRSGNVAASIPYELMSGQWGGIYFTSLSTGNSLRYTSIRNSSDGLVFAAGSSADIYDCQIRNTTNYIIEADHSNLHLTGCELADASNGILRLCGGEITVNHCTIANYYLFTALGGPAVQFDHIDAETDDESGLPYMKAEFSNTILYGNGTELSHGDLTGTEVYFRRCLLRSAGEDDDNFINCLWDEDPLYYTVRSEYLFDYRLKPESPAIGASDPSLDIWGLDTDRYGLQLHDPADLGAYVFVEPEQGSE